MDLENWTNRRADYVRAKRLVMGAVIGIVTVTGGVTFVFLTSRSAGAATQEDEPIAVELAKEPEPEPEPEPPPPPPQDKPHAAKAGPRLPRLDKPTELSDEKPEEKEPTTTGGSGDPFERAGSGSGSGAGTATAAVVAPPPPPPPPPPPRKPVRLDESMPAPVVVTPMKEPVFPPEAQSAGIEGNVVVLYVIGLDGSVHSAKAVKGPPEVQQACVNAIKTQKFRPYIFDGQPTEIRRIYVCKFKLR